MNETNPFTGQSTTGFAIPVPEILRNWGFRLQESLMDTSRGATVDGEARAFATAFAIAVLFGILHIIGPGHGKLFTIGYFGSRRAKLSEGITLSALVNVLDSLSAFLLVALAYGILSLSLKSAGALATRITQLVAYGAIAVLSIGHLISHTISSRKHHHHGMESTDAAGSRMKPWMLAVSVGLIPCPVSSAILTWGIVNGTLGFSILLVVGVSLGGMATMTVFSLILIGGKSGLVHWMDRRGIRWALTVFEVLSLVFLASVGILLFLMTL